MYSKQYSVYLDSIFKLVRSIVIKSEITSHRFNDDVYIKYGEGHYDPNDKTTWRYYKHLSGEYHSVDQMIYINSFDTHELIEFTKESLSLHEVTKHEYRVGTEYHKELVRLYPDMEDLIRGVLNPVDINEAIESDDFELLTYSSEFVEHNEYSLMFAVRDFIKGHSARYYNKQFNISDDLYASTYMACLSMMLIMMIIAHRKKMSKTSEAHSFHTLQYLLSHSKVGEQMQFLSHDQIMFFMRNIRHIERSVGKKEIFDWLRENLMDTINLPLNIFELRHDLTGMLDTLKPEPIFKKVYINSSKVVTSNDSYTYVQMLDKVDSLAPYNKNVRLIEQENYERQARYAIRNNATIKIIESYASSGGEISEKFSLDFLTIHHWMYLAAIGTLKGNIVIRMPDSSTILNLNPLDAFYVFYYSFALSNGVKSLNLPKLKAINVRIHKAVNQKHLNAITTDKYVSDSDITKAMSEYPQLSNNINIGISFKNYVSVLHDVINKQYVSAIAVDNVYRRSQLLNLYSRFWGDYTVKKYSITKYKDFFKKQGLNIDSFTDKEMSQIWQSIYLNVTGFDANTRLSIASVQSSMLRIMTQLSSYSVRYIGNTTGGTRYKVKSPVVRIMASYNPHVVSNAKSQPMYSMGVNLVQVNNVEIYSPSKVKNDLFSGTKYNFTTYSEDNEYVPKLIVKTDVVNKLNVTKNDILNIKLLTPDIGNISKVTYSTNSKAVYSIDKPSVTYFVSNELNTQNQNVVPTSITTSKFLSSSVEMKVNANFIAKIGIKTTVIN